jgi:hypothetical protein
MSEDLPASHQLPVTDRTVRQNFKELEVGIQSISPTR